nr:hypothetical protein [Akkermansia muciniphila]
MDMPSLVDEKAAAFKDYRVRLTPRVYLLDCGENPDARHAGYAV